MSSERRSSQRDTGAGQSFNSGSRRSGGSKSNLNLPSTDGRVWQPDYSGKYIHRKNEIDPISNKTPTDEEYDPYKHRNVKYPVNNFGTLIHLWKGSMGLGVFSMAMAFSKVGLVLGSIGAIFFGCTVSYAMNLLMKTSFLLCKRKRVGYLSYGQAMQYAMEEGPDWMIKYSKKARFMVNFVLASSQLSLCCAYELSVVKLVKRVVDDFNCEVFSLHVLICILLVVFFAVNYIPNMHVLAYFSAGANLMLITSFVMVFNYVFKHNERSPEPRSMFGKPELWPFFVDSCLFATQSIGSHSTAERYMKRPQDFLGFFGVMNQAICMITLTVWSVGFSGYWMFGDHTKGTLLAVMPENETITRSMRLIHACVLLINMRINSFVVIDMVWDEVIGVRYQQRISKKKRFLLDQGIVTTFTLTVFALSMAFTNYVDPITTLTGLVEGSLLIVGFPALMELCNLWPNNFGRYNWMYYKDLALFGFSLLLFATCLYVAVHNGVGPSSTSPCATRNATST